MSLECRSDARSRFPFSRSARMPCACRCSLSRQKVAFWTVLIETAFGLALAFAQLEAAAVCGAIASAASAVAAVAASGMRRRIVGASAAADMAAPGWGRLVGSSAGPRLHLTGGARRLDAPLRGVAQPG